MYIAMVASECAPVAKVGGLGDVVFGLGRELMQRGHQVEVVLPKYDRLRFDQIWEMQQVYDDLWVPWYERQIHCSVWRGEVHGLPCYFIDAHSEELFFNRGLFYGADDDALRFAFFSRATLEFLLKTGRRPDVIHCHDWQTALVPVLLYEMYAALGLGDLRACFTVHNFAHQGVAGPELLAATGLGRDAYFYAPERLRDERNPAKLNMLRSGIVYANFVTTVSPRHAWEVRYTDQGAGIRGALDVHHVKFGGVLNGIDYQAWNPEADPQLAMPYGIDTIDGKYANKHALRQRLWIREDYRPIVAYVGRLDRQKGVPLIGHAIDYTLARGGQFVLLGSSPDPAINHDFWALKQRLNDCPDCHFELGFNEELAHLIYAGADLIVMPSVFEPCGLTQMIAMRYGTVPVVRGVGGLADTVFDRDYGNVEVEQRNGYVFYEPQHHAIEAALERALGLWFDYPQEFRALMLAGMHQDNSWGQAAGHYANIYEHIRHK